MGPRTRLCAALIAVCFGCAACEGTSGDDGAAPASDPPTIAEQDQAIVAAPEEGTCWAVPPGKWSVQPEYWYDDSPTVPCSAPHTTETVKVLRLSEPTIDEAESTGIVCWDLVRRYLGVDPDSWVPWSVAAFLPSKEKVADGASWVRCDATFPKTWAINTPRTTTGSAESIADDPPPSAWACLDEDPQEAEQPFVPCDEPHTYEQTGKLAIINDLETYPGPAQLAEYARDLCTSTVPTELAGAVEVTAAWDPPRGLKESGYIAGACFMFTPSGEPLPPRS
jgi:hypothetical protein